MAYTTADRTLIDTAIQEFISGNRRSSVTFRDGRAVSFATVTLAELQGLRSRIYKESALKNRVRTSVFSTSKGL
jgi:hypothetical protein